MPGPNWIPVILAAGRSRRMGRPKLLMSHREQSVLGWTVQAVAAATGREPLVVAPGEGPVLREAMAWGVVAACNEHPDQGLSSSLKVAARATGQRGLLVFLGDQPLVSRTAVAKVLDEVATGANAWLVSPVFRGEVPGHPVYVSRQLLARVDSLSGERGARALAKDAPPDRIRTVVVDEDAPADLDTPEDWERIWTDADPEAPQSTDDTRRLS